ncbi:hypothetical protein L1987_84815 [Smallanthus sonchifolius]|uniref:Uncharacterized protein n=1 Tax=Smallanthus sonchifolius TaxID=185202 RepID=A0ACB8XWE0_9ASTR|nr:hypothetical protein L1987_84815 [Smallanthus sonchifolius]
MHLLLPPPPTLCSYSDHHPPPHRHLQFRTSHHKNLRYLKSLGIIQPKLTTETVSQILTTIQFLKSKGFSEPDFPRIAFLSPNLFTSDPKTLEPVFKFLTVELSASPEESRGLILKRPHILESDPEFAVCKLEEKMRFLEEVGFCEAESWRVCGRFPAIIGDEVKRFPQYFGFSLEKRIRPRHLHLKQRDVDMEVPLNRMLLWDDDRFYKKWK